MRYRIKKETKPTLPTYGKYKAVAVHYQTIDSRQIAKTHIKGWNLYLLKPKASHCHNL